MRMFFISKKKFNRFFLALSVFLFMINVAYSEEVIEIPKDSLKNFVKYSFNNSTDDNQNILIKLAKTHFDPLKNFPLNDPKINSIDSYKSDEIGYYIIQFDGPIIEEWKKSLKSQGAEIFDYIPDFSFIIRIPAKNELAVKSLPHVRWLGIYQPEYRVSQKVVDEIYGIKAAENTSVSTLRITVFPGENIEKIAENIKKTGGEILNTVTTQWKTTFKVKINNSNLVQLPQISGVKWIESTPEWKLFNNISADILGTRTVWNNKGLYGSGQVIAVCDTGLDKGSTSIANLHDDFEDGLGNARVIQIFDLVGDGASDVNSGHGTHVAGSILGNGYKSGSDPSANSFPSNCYAGMAPKASLIFQASEENTSESLSGLPDDLNTLFSQADGAGASIHSNSWGASVAGSYTSSAEDVDEYVWANKDFVILFAASNDGIDMDGDGVVDLYSLGSPGTAKNCITVGASENNRPSGAGIDALWGQAWAKSYSADPIKSDHVSNNINGMAAFSSRGPVLDGRYKPDIVAPGTNILSTKSSMSSGSGWGSYDSYYMYMGGTSMATPIAAGATAVMREYLLKTGSVNPSAALVKAYLLNTADDMTPGQYGTGSTQEISNAPVPNNVEGWGRLNLEKGIYPTSPFNFLCYDEQTGLTTSQTQTYDVKVVNSNAPLKVNLVWADYPGSTTAQGGLVNDLDLKINGPSSFTAYPDNASKKSSLNVLNYNDGTPEAYYLPNKVAIKFTPSSYPAYIESTSFYFDNQSGDTSDVSIIVYDDDGANGMPGGTQLFNKKLTYVEGFFVTVGIGIVISSGDFFISVEKISSTQRLIADNQSYGRSYYNTGSGWLLSSAYTAYISANLRGSDYSTSYDRVNNTLGVTVNNPTVGTYTINISGYNIPHGPQPYALVVSGNITSQSSKALPWIDLLLNR
ncbi:MAG: S8 family serine peptidase [Desulfobacterales bacterium]|nr:S8 family serine peptidase [Desulfobacterales bacterium]